MACTAPALASAVARPNDGPQTPGANLRSAWLAPLGPGVKPKSALPPVAVHISLGSAAHVPRLAGARPGRSRAACRSVQLDLYAGRRPDRPVGQRCCGRDLFGPARRTGV